MGGIGAWCERHGVDAWYEPRGYLRVNAFPRAPNDWDSTVGKLERLGLGEELVPWSAEQVQRVCASPAFGEGLFMRSAASVQPARLARGLRRVLLERGVPDPRGQPGARAQCRAGIGSSCGPTTAG